MCSGFGAVGGEDGASAMSVGGSLLSGVFGCEIGKGILAASLDEESLGDDIGVGEDALLEVSGVVCSLASTSTTQESTWLIGGNMPVCSYLSIQDGLSCLWVCHSIS